MVLVQNGELGPLPKQQRAELLAAIQRIEPFAPIALQLDVFVKMVVDDAHVVGHHMSHHPFADRREQIAYGHVAGKSVFEESLFRQRTQNEGVIVEIDKLLAEPLNAVKIQFNGVDVEHRQIFRGKVIFVFDAMELGNLCVQPVRQLAAGDKMYGPHPRSESLHAAKPVFQQAPVAETLLAGIVNMCVLGRIAVEGSLPCGVASIHPGYYKINRFHLLVCSVTCLSLPVFCCLHP